MIVREAENATRGRLLKISWSGVRAWQKKKMMEPFSICSLLCNNYCQQTAQIFSASSAMFVSGTRKNATGTSI